uniref:Anaphase-promoting complex subunit 1 n=1 Tax=Globodera rostochiensis TaxID=31243 RepID=A0A914H9E7_GLORO
MMIVPKTTKTLSPAFKGYHVIINHFVKNGVLVKRVEAFGREAVVFHGCSNQTVHRYSTDFDLINALFVTFSSKTPEDYLCLIGSTQIDFYALADGMYCSLALPFKICQANSVSFGLLLERNSLPGEFGSSPCAAQLFSLTHPYNEIFPILCKFKDDSHCHYTFRGRKMKVVPKDVGANWTSSFFGPNDLLMCYDFDERTNHIFMIRKCTKDERMAAKSDFGVMNSSALLHTPSSMQSFYSPNFFNRRFIENQMIGATNAQHYSPSVAINPITFSNNTSLSQPKYHQQNLANTSNGASVVGFASKVTPVRRYYTRSIAAAERLAFGINSNTFSAIFSQPSTTEKSPALRSLEHSATLNRMKLKQKLAMVASGSSLYTPRQVDMSDLLSFGERDGDGDDPPASLDMAVEFCLHWLWAESTEKVASKLERLRVSSSASSHSEDKSEMSRMASTFFISRNLFDKNDRYIVFHVPHERRVRILRLSFGKGHRNLSFIHTPILSYCAYSSATAAASIRGSAAVPFLHASYFMVLECLNLSEDQFCLPPSVALYHGHHKLAMIALNIGPNAHLLRLLPAGRCPKGLNLFYLQVITADEEDINSETNFSQIETQNSISELQLGFGTEVANRCFYAICVTLQSEHQLNIVSRSICTNPWRIVLEAEQIPCVNELPADRVELALLFELLFNNFGVELSTELPYRQLLGRIREHMGEDLQGGSVNKRTRLNDVTAELTENDEFWDKLQADMNLIHSTSDLNAKCIRHLYQVKILERRVLNFLRKVVDRDSGQRKCKRAREVVTATRHRLGAAGAFDCVFLSSSKRNVADVHKWVTASRWMMDLRLHNVKHMLDPSLPILIPNKAFGMSFNDVQQREQHEQFLVSVAIRTLARPFGQALLHFRTRHGFSANDLDPAMGMRQICLNGRVHPGRNQVDYPLNESFPTHKTAMDWANFYNALARGLSFCGGFPQCLFSNGPPENELPSTVRAGLILAAGLVGNVRNVMNLYDIHVLLTQNNRHLVIALLVGCAAAYRGTSEVHIYKIIATHLPFLLQPTLCEFRIDLVVQTAALISLGLLFCETSNHTVSSQLLNQMSLEVPCESDQSSDRYAFVLAAGFAIGLINLGKGKEISDTEIPISSSPSLKDRLIKLLKGGERRMAYLNYDHVRCSCMRVNNVVGPRMGGASSSVGRTYTPGGGGIHGAIESLNGGTHDNGGPSGQSVPRHVDHSGIGQPSSSHVRELPTLNIHLTSPSAAIALGLIYLRTGDSWISDTLAIVDTFYEIDQIRPDMLMVRTLSRCLVDFDEIKCTQEWIETQIPEIIRKYAKHFLEIKSKEEMWWAEFIDMNTVAKAYFYCYAGALFALALRFASKWDIKALRLIQHFYGMTQIDDAKNATSSDGHSMADFAIQAGKNCINACINVSALCMALVMAGSGDLQTTRLLRKIRNTFHKIGEAPIPRDTSVHSLHVSTNMALGLLYLGHGRLCISNSNLAIASLVISLFPLFPHSIIDNRFYFQSIRFLWVLAISPASRCEIVHDGLETGNTFAQRTVDCPRCGNITVNKCL